MSNKFSFTHAFATYILERDTLFTAIQNKTIKLSAANAKYTSSVNHEKNLVKVSYECKMSGVFEHFIMSAKDSHSIEDLEEDIRAFHSFIGFISDNMAHEREQVLLYVKVVNMFSNAYTASREIDGDVAEMFYNEMEESVETLQDYIDSE